MGKKNSDLAFSAFIEQLKDSKVKASKVEVKQERKYFLIVSEGKRTEPIYFEYFSDRLPRNLLNTIDVHGEGDNTINVVNIAIKMREKRKLNKQLPQYDEVWAVFDKDDFPASRYNEAISLASRNGIESGHSNQSFELWYVLHFQFLQSALHRNDYITTLTDQLGFKYTKNTSKVVDELFRIGNVKQAIKWARELESIHIDKTPSDSCPYTRVYVLVERLLQYIEGIN